MCDFNYKWFYCCWCYTSCSQWARSHSCVEAHFSHSKEFSWSFLPWQGQCYSARDWSDIALFCWTCISVSDLITFHFLKHFFAISLLSCAWVLLNFLIVLFKAFLFLLYFQELYIIFQLSTWSNFWNSRTPSILASYWISRCIPNAFHWCHVCHWR